LRTVLPWLALFGIAPSQARQLRHLPRFLRDRREFKRQGGRIASYYPILMDYADSSGVASGHYFHQDLLVAQFILSADPASHADVASRIDGFVAHIAASRKIDVLDIRPLTSIAHPNINFVQADLMLPLPHLAERYDSVSCLHALEHFGLGRYTDTVDVDGHLAGFNSILNLVKPGGTLYMSFPVGTARVEFNAHRIFDPADILDWGKDRVRLLRFDYVDDQGDLHKEQPVSAAAGLQYGCGIYTLVKIG
jgi:SAM-dependent methyltransferase